MSDEASQFGPSVQRRLRQSRIGHDLLTSMQATSRPDANLRKPYAAAPTPPEMFAVVIEVNASLPGGSHAARLALLASYLRSSPQEETRQLAALRARIDGQSDLPGDRIKVPDMLFSRDDALDVTKSLFTENYLFGRLSRETVNSLSSCMATVSGQSVPLVHKVWADHAIERCMFESVRTIKCDAARAAFTAVGTGIVWAVADTGIDGTHPHFETHATLTLPNGPRHRDFTKRYPDDDAAEQAALMDTDGHGTHVAGIIAGETPFDSAAPAEIHREVMQDEDKTIPTIEPTSCTLSGMAPRCKLLSLKVLETGQVGSVSSLLAAIGYLQTQNENGRNLKVHGLNISLGYLFNPEWYAAGSSPLCVEIDRLVRSGVMVVCAAGNGGYGTVTTYLGSAERASHVGTITDPGNAALALTVGSTHRESPHTFGISYFSGKGPTGDGRMKPDLVAPGERIVSCARMVEATQSGVAPFKEDSGTSMATPHVSGAAAAFMSVRSEYKGQPERLKAILLQSATDLARSADFQGAGMIDLMRALQTV